MTSHAIVYTRNYATQKTKKKKKKKAERERGKEIMDLFQPIEFCIVEPHDCRVMTNHNDTHSQS